MDEKYFAKKVEQKWQKIWADSGAFHTEIDETRPKFYALEMLPYPSGNLHMGHVRNYSAGDALAWYKRLRGFNVLHPIGWDSFGQPAEDAAVKRGVNPRDWTEQNIIAMRGQLERLGLSYDWRRQMYAHRPEYYKFDQWLFLKMYEMGLAYKKQTQVNWCSTDQATLSNEQASGGMCWRCGNPVTKKDLDQWFLKTTAYTDQLLDDMAEIENGWPASVIKRQSDWMGRSEGAFVDFEINASGDAMFSCPIVDGITSATDLGKNRVRVFTTRIDTIYGVNALVLAAEHPVIQANIDNFAEEVASKIAFIRAENAKPQDHEIEIEKDGIDTGLKATNPFSGEEIPVWVGNYVMMNYGTGAVMSVPGHDERDFEFAKKFGLPIKQVISAETEIQSLKTAYSEEVKLFENPRLSHREQQIHDETFAFLQENVEELIAKCYQIHGTQIINADRSKELFEVYNENRLLHDRAVQPSASALTRLILRRRLNELPERATVVLTAGGQASGKSTAIRENMTADLIYDSVMASVEGNRKVLDLIAEKGYFARIIYVYRPIEHAVIAMMRRQGVEGRVVSEENMASGHFGSQQAFITDTDAYARSKGFTVAYKETIEDEPPKTISLNELKKKAYNSKEEVLQRIIYGTDHEYERNEYGRDIRITIAESNEDSDAGRLRSVVQISGRTGTTKYVDSSSPGRTAATHDSPEIVFSDYGFLINSGKWSGQTSENAKTEMAAFAAANGFGQAATTYRLRDWGISRQRFWGSPIPIIYCDGCGTVPEKFENLPVELPETAPFTGTGESPLAKVPEFYQTTCPKCDGPAKRETDTMDTFVDSSWYYFRYTDPTNEILPFDPQMAAYWAPIDQYIGGDDHAVMHLIYARFWTKVMRDMELIPFGEPFKRLLTQGMVVGETFFDDSTGKRIYYPADQVTVERDEKGRITSATTSVPGAVATGVSETPDSALGTPHSLKHAIERMSKSKGNGVDPDEMVEIYGADAARLFVMFAAPIENELVWNEAGIEGSVRFLQRVWRLVNRWQSAVGGLASVPPAVAGGDFDATQKTPRATAGGTDSARVLRRKTHQTIKRVSDSFETLQFNTPVAALMELSNAIGDIGVEPTGASEADIFAVHEALTALTVMLTPFAPHTAEELYSALVGNDDGMLAGGARFPEFNADLAKADEIEFPVQINGKLRSRIVTSPETPNDELERLALTDEKIREFTDGKEIVKVVVVPKRLVNIVVR